jgi:Tol biopolymer transport system component/DNA-binding winged helix-turn-helix (wHTH) protein
MTRPVKHLYEFGPFRLDTAEHLLLRDGTPVALTPKAFETLVVLVRNSGHLVYKDDLMREVWPDTVVEENNLDKSISALRKALGEESPEHTYIETVRRRGYRFVANVKEVSDTEPPLRIVRERTRSSVVIEEETEIQDQAEERGASETLINVNAQPTSATVQAPALRTTSSASVLTGEIKPRRRGLRLALLAVALAVAVAAASFLFYSFLHQNSPFEKVRLSRLSTTGKVSRAAISPDGKYLAYVVNDTGQQSLWIRQVATNRNLQIVAPASQEYFGLTFSHDGDYVYFVSWEMNHLNMLFRVPSLGGAPTKLLEDVDTPVTLSPDDKRLAFVRIVPQARENSIIVAGVDGTGERKIFSDSTSSFKLATQPDAGATSPAWSPDGKTIACPVRITDSGGEYETILGFPAEGGAAKPLTPERWQMVGRMEWLSDGSGLVLAAAEQESAPARQIWYVSYPKGEARKVTNDLNDYQDVSLTLDSRTLVTVQSERQANIWVAPDGDATRAAQVTFTNYDGLAGISWTPEGKIVYTSHADGNEDLWIVGTDGSDQRQLTDNAGINRQPVVTPDGRYIVFVSERAGVRRLWRADAEGRHLLQLTNGRNDVDPDVSPDGRWVAFKASNLADGLSNIFRVPIDGGDPARMTSKLSGMPSISPDGRMIAFYYREEMTAPNKFAVQAVEGVEPKIISDLPRFSGRFKWTPDGQGLAYVSDRNGFNNIWVQPLDGSAPRQLTDFKSDRIFSFDWSRDGKQLACARGIVISNIVQISDLR